MLGCLEVAPPHTLHVTVEEICTQKITLAAICPYECLQNDVLEYQSKGAQIYGDFNARTAEVPSFLKAAELQSFLPTAPDDDELPDNIPLRQFASGGYWGFAIKLISLRILNKLVLNGKTLGDECGHFTFQSAHGQSFIDYFTASEKCMAATQSLHVLEEASRSSSDHHPLILRVAYLDITLLAGPCSIPIFARASEEV